MTKETGDEFTPSSERNGQKLLTQNVLLIVLITTNYTLNHCYVITLLALR